MPRAQHLLDLLLEDGIVGGLECSQRVLRVEQRADSEAERSVVRVARLDFLLEELEKVLAGRGAATLVLSKVEGDEQGVPLLLHFLVGFGCTPRLEPEVAEGSLLQLVELVFT